MFNKKLFSKLLVAVGVLSFIITILTLLSVRPKELNYISNQESSKNPISAPKAIVNENKEDTAISVLIAGDLSTSGLTGEVMVQSKASPFQFIRSYTANFDLAIANLEVNISKEGVTKSPANKTFRLEGPANETINSLLKGGIDAVSLANNHSMDFGKEAFVSMTELLSENNITYFGGGLSIDEAYSAKYIKLKDTIFALLAFNEIETNFSSVEKYGAGSAEFNETRIEKAIQDAEADSDIVIVMPHWGVEHQPKASQNQKTWGRKFIDFGADIVIGSHPHIIQESEIYKDKYIFYSLGNFIFSGFSWIETGTKGLVVELKVDDREIKEVYTRNILINYHGFPELVE